MRPALSISLLLCALAFPISGNATGLYQCEVTDRTSWLTKTDLTTQLEAEGWSIRRIKEDGGCWEVYGTNPEGTRVEGYFHPVTGKAQIISQRGRILFRAE